jgi:hypothetical protein
MDWRENAKIGLQNLIGTGEQRLRYSDEERKISVASKSIGWTVVSFGVGAVFVIASWAYGASAGDTSAHFAAFFGADLLVAGAAASAGALFGFIFGIPRTLDPASRAVVATAAKQAGGPVAASNAVMAANTNLERISDWLTTLLVGATLVQIREIAGWIGSLGRNLVTAGPAANEALVPVIIIYYFALAFLGVYLITRLYLTSAFHQAIGMLAGAQPSETADVRATNADTPPRHDLRELKEKLRAAATSGETQVLNDAIAAYKDWNSTKNELDPELNADVARILAKQIASGAATEPDLAEDLKKSIKRAVADPAIKAVLREEYNAGGMTTNRVELDREIAAVLNS